MNIDDKALLRLMKSSYKGGGVKVFRTVDGGALFLNGGFWAVALPWKTVPGPVLGLITEWMRYLITPGEGYWCLHGNEESFDDLSVTTCGLYALQKSQPCPPAQNDIKLLDIHIGGGQAAQLKDQSVRWFPEDGTVLLAGPSAGEMLVDGAGTAWGRWHESDRGGVCWLGTINRVSDTLTRKLAEYDFWNGESHE